MSEALTVKVRLKRLEDAVAELQKRVPPAPFVPEHPPIKEEPSPPPRPPLNYEHE
jgi:hypothetical protein